MTTPDCLAPEASTPPKDQRREENETASCALAPDDGVDVSPEEEPPPEVDVVAAGVVAVEAAGVDDAGVDTPFQ